MNNNSKGNKIFLMIYIPFVIIGFIALPIIYFMNINKTANNVNTNIENNGNNIINNNEFNNDYNDNNTNNKVENNTINNTTTNSKWNGIYTNNNDKIYVYQISEDEINFSAELESNVISATADITDNKAIADIFDTYELILNNGTIEFSSSDEEIEKKTYTKTEEYTKEDFFNKNYGNIQYLNTNINGIFNLNDTTIKIYQKSDKKVRVSIKQNYTSWISDVELENGTINYEKTRFGETLKINITFNNDTIIINASSSDPNDLLNKINGTYNKTSAYTIDQIIQDK